MGGQKPEYQPKKKCNLWSNCILPQQSQAKTRPTVLPPFKWPLQCIYGPSIICYCSACVWNTSDGQDGKPSGLGGPFGGNPVCHHNSSGPCIYAVPKRLSRIESHLGYVQLILKEGFSSYSSAPINFIDSMNLCLRTSFLPPNHHIIETFQASCSSDIKMFTFHSGIHCQHRSDKKTKRRSNWILIYLESIIDKSWYWHKSWVLTIK